PAGGGGAAARRGGGGGPRGGGGGPAGRGRGGGCHFGEFARQWPGWLYGSDAPDGGQRARLRLAYLSWGRRCVSAPRWMARPVLWRRRRSGGAR
ncbi:hypothetical protein ACLH0T_21325, partial [Aeromonas media]